MRFEEEFYYIESVKNDGVSYMKQNNSNNDTVKRIILVFVSVGVGTLINNILGNIEMNIWFARAMGALSTVATTLLLYHLLIKNNKKYT